MLLELQVSEGEIGFVVIVLESAAFHFVKPVHVLIILVGRHVSAFTSLFPANGKDIFPAFEEVLEQVQVFIV